MFGEKRGPFVNAFIRTEYKDNYPNEVFDLKNMSPYCRIKLLELNSYAKTVTEEPTPTSYKRRQDVF